ncbi:hypothetical protein [Mycolicibacterium llatzerense]|uniref:Uncharacterized protein n=1 Tax=Mycolicibacterium llatzerense TaxID=280871 RepID=A0A0D1LC02_9MYCO|nr:hypothetical protein [Mycolicibacterium llatzerense]KIU18315.1 hypothetical protein TL10_02360 [Mycolicibacterium llatzerense]
MRFFTDGHTVIRVNTDARLSERQKFLDAKAETFQFRKRVWAEKPGLTQKIAFTGDWQECSEDEAYAVLESSGAKIRMPA